MRHALIALALIACDSPGGGAGQTVDQEATCLESEQVATQRWICTFDSAPGDVMSWCDEAFAERPNWVPCLQAFESVPCDDVEAFDAAWEVCLREASGP